MKHALILALVGALAVSGCNNTPGPIPSSPAVIADKTVIDEVAGISAETLYTTASTLGNALSRAGRIDRAKFQALDAEAYQYLLAVRSAYKAGNSQSYAEALANLNVTVGKIRELAK